MQAVGALEFALVFQLAIHHQAHENTALIRARHQFEIDGAGGDPRNGGLQAGRGRFAGPLDFLRHGGRSCTQPPPIGREQQPHQKRQRDEPVQQPAAPRGLQHKSPNTGNRGQPQPAARGARQGARRHALLLLQRMQQHRFGVQSEIVGVVAQKAADENAAGQIAQPVIFQCFKIDAGNSRCISHFDQGHAAQLPFAAQHVADTFLQPGLRQRKFVAHHQPARRLPEGAAASRGAGARRRKRVTVSTT